MRTTSTSFVTAYTIAALLGAAVVFGQAAQPAPAKPDAPKTITPAPAKATPVAAGEMLKPVTLQDKDGKTVELASLYAKKPIVLTFYRGGWCPFCNRQLTEWQTRLDELEKMGAMLVAVSLEMPEHAKETAEKGKLTYTVLTDETGAASRAFGLAFAMDEATQEKYKGYGIDLSKRNAAGRWELPVPGTFVIDTKGMVRFAFADEDYKKRAKIEDVMNAVKDVVKVTPPNRTKSS